MSNAQSKGGHARAEAMTAEERSESARQAALARWGEPGRATVFAIRSTMGADEAPVWWSDAWNSWEEDRSRAGRYPYHAAVERLASLFEAEGDIARRARIVGLWRKS